MRHSPGSRSRPVNRLNVTRSSSVSASPAAAKIGRAGRKRLILYCCSSFHGMPPQHPPTRSLNPRRECFVTRTVQLRLSKGLDSQPGSLFISRIDSEPENQILRETSHRLSGFRGRLHRQNWDSGDGWESPPESFFVGGRRSTRVRVSALMGSTLI